MDEAPPNMRLLGWKCDKCDTFHPEDDIDPGDRLYWLLGRFDTRDGSQQAEIVQRAREAYEAWYMGDYTAWEEYDAFLARLSEGE